MFQQGLGLREMLERSGYDPYEQARRQQQAMQQYEQARRQQQAMQQGLGSLSQAAVEAQREDYERAERARKAETERAEHNRKLLLLEE